MKDYKEFKVTTEILELFRNEKVSAKTVKKLIPNYMEYQIKHSERVSSKYLEIVTAKISEYLCKSHFTTAQGFLDGIQFILECEGILTPKNTQEIFHFDGSSLDEYGYYEISETSEKMYIESEKDLLERLCSEIRTAKKKEKEELLLEQQNIKITHEMLTKIANDANLMSKLLELKGK